MTNHAFRQTASQERSPNVLLASSSRSIPHSPPVHRTVVLGVVILYLIPLLSLSGCSAVREVHTQRVTIVDDYSGRSAVIATTATNDCDLDDDLKILVVPGIGGFLNALTCFDALGRDEREFKLGAVGFISGLVIGFIPMAGYACNCVCDSAYNRYPQDATTKIPALDIAPLAAQKGWAVATLSARKGDFRTVYGQSLIDLTTDNGSHRSSDRHKSIRLFTKSHFEIREVTIDGAQSTRTDPETVIEDLEGNFRDAQWSARSEGTAWQRALAQVAQIQQENYARQQQQAQVQAEKEAEAAESLWMVEKWKQEHPCQYACDLRKGACEDAGCIATTPPNSFARTGCLKACAADEIECKMRCQQR